MKKTKKLDLKRTTLIVLTPEQLRDAAAGGKNGASGYCVTREYCQTTGCTAP